MNLKKPVILIILPLFMGLFLYCEQVEDVSREKSTRDRIKDKEKSPIRTTNTDEYYGQYNSSDYKGADCEDLDKDDDNYQECREICKKLYRREADKCEDLPAQLVLDLDELFINMQRLRADEDDLERKVSSFDFGVMIDIHHQPVLELIKRWSQREVAEFLIWVAQTVPVGLALRHHDKENKILTAAFKEFGDGAPSGADRLNYGIGKNLRGTDTTFWSMAEEKKNIGAFIAMHRLLEDICDTKDCKLRLYCLREEFSSRDRRKCKYSSASAFRVQHCYVHGPSVWSYWESLNKEGEFSDSDFSRDSKMNEDICDGVCRQAGACKRPV